MPDFAPDGDIIFTVMEREFFASGRYDIFIFKVVHFINNLQKIVWS